MVNIPQIQRGFVRFVDDQVAVAFTGWQKALVAGGAGLLSANLPKLVAMYANHPIVAAMGIYDATNEAIDVDALYTAFVPKLGADKFPIAIPKIGTIKMGQAEIDTLMRYIKEA